MPTFSYEAVDPKGRVVEGSIESSSVDAVIEELRGIHFTVVTIKEKKDYLAFVHNYLRKSARVDFYAVTIFTRQFATLINAGLPILKCLEALSRQSINTRLTATIDQIMTDLKAGFSLTRALQKHPRIFSPVYIALVRAGEMSGAVGLMLDRMALLMEREHHLRQKVSSSLTYPAFVFAICIAVTVFLVTYIFPSFVSLLEGLDLPLPWPTLVLIHLTNALKNPVVLILLAVTLGLAIAMYRQFISTPLGRKQVDRLLIDIPVIGQINRKVSLSQFCRTLGTLLGSGIPIIHSLDVVGKVAGNEVIAGIVDDIKLSLKGGDRISDPLKEYDIFPPMVPHMISVGEETGNLAGLLEKLADYFDQEVEMALQAFVTLIEPVMIMFMGGIVGYVLIAVFLPVYQILQKF
jgi:type IV pilus assembly protein PilC